MKLSKIFHNLKNQAQLKLQDKKSSLQLLLTFFVIFATISLIWFAGPYVEIFNTKPLAAPEKRIYLILFLGLIWTLKFLLLDLDAPNPFKVKDPVLKEKLQALQKRFQGAIKFLNNTSISKRNPQLKLSHLPWYLLIGSPQAGKTSLLSNAKVHFILHRQIKKKNNIEVNSIANCDWWVTKDATIIDVPGVFVNGTSASTGQRHVYMPLLWRYLLQLIKKARGKSGIKGIILVISFADIKKYYDSKKNYLIFERLFKSILELKKQFTHDIECQIIITKSDLLSGFKQYFADLTDEELHQVFGVFLENNQQEPFIQHFTQQFNLLIKKINSQLIAKLHHERDQTARPYIKDFPLQLERLKNFTVDFIKKLQSVNIKVQGLYLTSAMQPDPIENTIVSELEESNTSLILQPASVPSRAYFIKQFFTHCLSSQKVKVYTQPVKALKKFATYAFSLSVILAVTMVIGRDFKSGSTQTYTLEDKLKNYQYRMQTVSVSDRLMETLHLLNDIHQPPNSFSKFNLEYFTKYFSNKSQQVNLSVYYQAIRGVLLPELKLHLEEYLAHPLNKDTNQYYRVLKAYVMLGDNAVYDANFVLTTLKEIDPTDTNTPQDMQHILLALHHLWQPIGLNNQVTQLARHYLNALPKVQLGYLILRNINGNSNTEPLNLGIYHKTNLPFNPNSFIKQMPLMYTVNNFATIMGEEVVTASEEAINGNWVLGESQTGANHEQTLALVDQLRVTYINRYIDTWEDLLNKIKLNNSENLADTTALLAALVKDNSPLYQLLQTTHDNTYFEPILSSSVRLHDVGTLIEEANKPDNLLNQIVSSLKQLHHDLNGIVTAHDIRKTAFEAVNKRMKRKGDDSLTILRSLAEKSPQPIKEWLNNIADVTWQQLMKESAYYIDISWQQKVGQIYQTELANRYPFNSVSDDDVALQTFSQFFGNPGVFMDFYKTHLQTFIDDTSDVWHWKTVDNISIPLSPTALKFIQKGVAIHSAFFPKDDNQLALAFHLKRLELSNHLKQIKLNINEKLIKDDHQTRLNNFTFTWPNLNKPRITNLQIVTNDRKTINKDFPGDWGWFKLIKQSFDQKINDNEIILNLSFHHRAAKYSLLTENQIHNVLSDNLFQFSLPLRLIS